MNITATSRPATTNRLQFPCFRRWVGPVESSDSPRKIVLFFNHSSGVIVFPSNRAGEFSQDFVRADDPDWAEWHGEVKFFSQ